jgi:T5SS/PEP-CTERM-associated repeat protein
MMKKKFITQLAIKFTKKNATLLTVIALALCALPAIALSDDILCPNPYSTTWTGAIDNNWFTSGNWTNGVPICSPDVQYYALINNGTPQINTGVAASACQVSLAGNSSTDSSTLSVGGSGSSLTTCSNTYVGYQGKGKLSVTSGAAVTTQAVASIASLTGSNGSATVDGTSGGTNSTWAVVNELDVGGLTNASGGTGLLTVTNSATVSAASVLVWGSGTLTGNGTVSTTSGVTIAGTLTPSGTPPNDTLTINGNLTFSSGTMECDVVPDGADNVNVSGVASLNGKLSVTMTGTTFRAGTTYTL